ncbi:MAG TPA: murein biosynthesis integral membrane protein MurJ, partial [Oscillatoriaceae cyanobacterium]
MGKGLLGVASAIAVLTLLSKGFGFFRELVVAAGFGAGVAKDAYTAAYIIPAFSLIMLGGLTGPFHTGAQKVMTAMRGRGEDEAVPGVMATILLAVTLIMGALSVVAYFEAPWLIRLVASQASPDVFAMAVAQLRVMSPLVLIGGLVGILCGISNDRGDFTLPSLSPLIASVAVIVAVLWRRGDPMALAWGTMLGGVGQLLLQAPAGVQLLRSGPIRWEFKHAEVHSLFWLLLPASISSTVGTLNVIIGTNFASALPKGQIGIFDYANKLIQLPLGILMTALLIPVFPLLTQAVVAGDQDGLFRRLNQGISTIALSTLPLIAVFVAAGRPIVAVMYQRGAFTSDATKLTYEVLAFAALGIFTYASRDMMIRVFYALDDSRTPLLVSLFSMGTTAAGMWLVI